MLINVNNKNSSLWYSEYVFRILIMLSCHGLSSISSSVLGGRKWVVGQSYGKCHAKLTSQQAPELLVPPFNQVHPLQTPYTDILSRC